MTAPIQRPASQREMIAQSLAESVLDTDVALGYPAPTFALSGVSSTEYYRAKHALGGPGVGKFFPLHQVKPVRH